MMKKLLASSIIATLLIVSMFSTAAFAKHRTIQTPTPAPTQAAPTDPTDPTEQTDQTDQTDPTAPTAPTPAPTQAAPSAPTAPTPAPTQAAPSAPTAPTSTQADKLIAFAVSLQGKVQYGYSKRVTSNPNNMILDCSSFTQYVYKQALGVKMGWGANIQHNAFPHVAKADLRKGDLVFFSVSNPSKIGHVGIYIGDGKFIHNVNTKSDVVIADLTTGYWNKHYIDASRPLN